VRIPFLSSLTNKGAISKARRTVASGWERAPKALKQTIRPLLWLALLLIIAELAIRLFFPVEPERLAWSSTQITELARERLTAIRINLDSASQRFLRDPFLVQSLDRYSTPADVLPHLERNVRIWQSSTPDSIRRFGVLETGDTLGYGAAVYNAQGRLVAWYSNQPGTFGFDTLLSTLGPLERKSRLVERENGPIYTYLSEYRKVISKTSNVIGYITVKRLLASHAPFGAGAIPTTTYLEDIKPATRREFVLDFRGHSTLMQNESYWKSLLYAEKGDSSSFVGVLGVSKTPIEELPGVFQFVNHFRKFIVSLLLLSILIWLVSVASRVPASSRPLLSRLVRSVLVVCLIVIIRLVLYWSEGLSLLVGPQFQDAWGFGTDWGFGIASNPFELFITCLFASISAVILWLIWMPRKKLIVDDSSRPDISIVTKKEAPYLLLFVLTGLAITAFLGSELSSIVESLIQNSGSIRYLTVRQVLPAPTVLMMYLAFLNLGVTFLFLGSLFFTFGVRAVIFIIPRSFTLVERVTIGSIVYAVIAFFVAIAVSSLDGGELPQGYVALVVALLLAISIGVVVADTFMRDAFEEESPSLLYRLPRSSRSVLFILAASTILMSPLIAAQEQRTNMDVAESMVLKDATVDETFLANEVERALRSAANELTTSESTQQTSISENIKQTAFITWLSAFADHPEWEAALDVVNSNGVVVSHFSTEGSSEQLPKINAIYDSAQSTSQRLNDPKALYGIHLVPCFTTGCQPLVWGIQNITAVGESGKQSSYSIKVAVWSNLPFFGGTRRTFELLRSDKDRGSSNQLISEGGFVLAQYRPGARRITNVPSLDVPASLPFNLLRKLHNVEGLWARTYINGNSYQTYFRRLSDPQEQLVPTVIAVSVPEPGFLRVIEFALRLNAIGLLYGISIALILLIVRQVSAKRIRFIFKFRDRIFLIVLTIALLPLVVVTNVTRNLLEERALSEERDRISRDASVITDRISRKIDTTRSFSGAGVPQFVSDLSQVMGRHFNVYDNHGYLKASSNPEFYESTILADELNPSAVQEILIGKKSFYTEPLKVGSQVYQVSYQPLSSVNGDSLIGVVSVAAIQERSNIEANIARTTSLIYGTFAALGLILLGIGAFFAARVAKPIVTLISATERVAKGKLGTSIPVNRDDEIGELMHAFNAMTSELEKSRQMVAQTEREMAWKEMARQVAHEIKNPLTPMKLSVQHLEHAHESKDPNFSSIFKRVIRTLSEQIDVLTRIATEFSRFGEMPRRKYGPVSVRKVAESAVALFDAERHRIRFIVDVPKGISYIHADEEEFRRLLVNLLRNAIQAIEGWGVIVIRATEDRGMIHIKISDTGSGMSEETLKKAFDPNFSTKTSGMGLGLAIVKKTITDMSGTITVESALGRGTTFFIDLPAREGGARMEQAGEE